ncbi:hypothetical protein AAFF_G00234150 [Aldrovandia affinis]|uniref:Uncharacterized protein n=1 Tax=Aldrovandia affinis TaxID=143900 RepID=A0AAD7QZS9_9TELE|nr:hypothetical protein AAFF_G00234150 [Aldrovandia affinis]
MQLFRLTLQQLGMWRGTVLVEQQESSLQRQGEEGIGLRKYNCRAFWDAEQPAGEVERTGGGEEQSNP